MWNKIEKILLIIDGNKRIIFKSVKFDILLLNKVKV